jgi:aminomethyltransferase
MLKKTALHGVHVESGARLVPFAGWEMPVQYQGVVDEHMAVRTRAGLFDVSHMGEIEVKGTEALAFLQRTTCNDVAKLKDGQAQYSAVTNPEGGFVDDVLVHRMEPERFLLCVNASNVEKVHRWLTSQAEEEVYVSDRSADFAQLALQGPAAAAIIGRVLGEAPVALKRYRFLARDIDGEPALIARTGYTGEDGFEIYLAPASAPAMWRRLIEEGKPEGLVPAGLAARDTLRLEAKMALYGNDIDATTSVLEADLGWIVSFEKGNFVGREVLARQRAEGPARLLVGFEMEGRGIARQGYPIRIAGREAGLVTSGTFAPFLKKNIGLAYLPAAVASPGNRFEVVIRDKPVPAVVVPTPFYRRGA